MTIAFWCVLIAALLPYVAFGMVSGSIDRNAPRLGVSKLEGRQARAYGAHLNAFETFAPFAAAVIIAHIVEGASATINWLAVIYIVVRLGHLGFYLADRPPLRSAAFFLGLLVTIIIFVQPAFH